jgi:hypothetical protein
LLDRGDQTRMGYLCRLPQRPSLTLHPLGGSTPRMWPSFLLRAKGKRKEMTGTQHVGTLKHQVLQYITIKNVFVLFHYQNNFEMNYSSDIWWRHLPAACNNFFEAVVSGNISLYYGTCLRVRLHMSDSAYKSQCDSVHNLHAKGVGVLIYPLHTNYNCLSTLF